MQINQTVNVRKVGGKTGVRRIGSGRTKGSFSFIAVDNAVLRQYIAKRGTCLVSRKWCEAVGLNTLSHCAAATALQKRHLV